MLRWMTAISYGMALLLSALSLVGLVVADGHHGRILGGWAFCVAALFALGRLAHLVRSDEP